MKLHLVDGTYELYRTHYAPRPGHYSPSGSDAKATVGIVESLLSLLSDPKEAVTHIAVAFDNPIHSFRNTLFPEYKSDEGVPPELRAQFDAAEAAVSAMGLTVWSMRDYEADDGLATGARLFRDQVEQVRILTPDKDLGQSLVDNLIVQVDRRQKKVITEATLRTEWGFGPKSIPDFLALTGDSADGFPGLPGFGKKTSSQLLSVYERLEAIPGNPANWKVDVRGASRLAATLIEQREEAFLYRKLATLVETVPLRATLQDLEFLGVPRDRFECWCDELGVQRLKTAPKRWR